MFWSLFEDRVWKIKIKLKSSMLQAIQFAILRLGAYSNDLYENFIFNSNIWFQVFYTIV